MENRISYALKKCKSVFIIAIILWVILSIVLIVPITISWTDSIVKNQGDFVNTLISNMGNLGGNFLKAFSKEYILGFLKGELFLTIALLFITIVGIIKTLPKHDYAGVENGSSDWATGEQYSVLSKNKGILLAEKHYLPVDKRGNVNVLIVGRIRFW